MFIKLIFFQTKHNISRFHCSNVLIKYKKITVVHDSLFWDYPKNYNFLWRKYFILMINLGINTKTHIITTC